VLAKVIYWHDYRSRDYFAEGPNDAHTLHDRNDNGKTKINVEIEKKIETVKRTHPKSWIAIFPMNILYTLIGFSDSVARFVGFVLKLSARAS